MKKIILQDLRRNGKEKPWAEHKTSNESLALAYDEINFRKAERLKNCANKLSFAVTPEGLKLRGAEFCRVRLCPMCTWRRSLKVAAQMTKIMAAIKEDKPMAYILITLTVRNCEPEELGETLDLITTKFKNLTKTKAYMQVSHGYYRAIEVTHNLEEDTYHPHIHAIFAVDEEYFRTKKYIDQMGWTVLWRKVLHFNYNPFVYVQRVRGNTAKAVAEVAKYSVKSKDYIIPDDWKMTVKSVKLLDDVLNGRRFVGLGGVFKEYHKKLKLDDIENGDLVHVEGEEKVAEDERVIHFAWFSGYRQYRRNDE